MKKKHTPMSVKLAITMILLVLGTVALGWIVNALFLEKYYIQQKKQELVSGYEQLEKAYEQGILGGDDFDVTFETLCANHNFNILVVDGQLKVIRTSSPDVQVSIKQLQQMIVQLKLSQKDYMILHQTDSRLMSEYLVLWGEIGNGSYAYMRTAVESIRESVALTNRFFFATGLLGVFLSVIVICIIVRRTTGPIREITEVSRAMSNLRFEVRYEPKDKDSRELAELGEHMNYMSYILEKTISDLKTANNELKQDIAQKEQIDLMRREFLSNVSHELKTPLALIQGYAEGLKEGMGEDAESREYYCDVIMDEAEKMNHMVKQLLSLNQLEYGNEQLTMSRFDIVEMIRGLVTANRILAEPEGITILFEEQEPLYVWGDSFLVEEVFNNYLSNALHHAEGEKKIQICTQKQENIVRICVRNTGNQIPQEDLGKIWEKFYKVDKARTRVYGGSGVGLSIVRAIMESMHQGYGVHNVADGVEFWFELESK